MLRAVLFDMDGVIVDSEAFICEAAVAMFRERGLTVQPSDFVPFVGMGENRYLGGVAERYAFPLDLEADKRRTYEIFAQIIKGRLSPLPGSLDFVRRCKERGLRIALATSADLVKVTSSLGEIGLALSLFDAVVNGLDVVHRKPHPEIYLTAASRLGVQCTESLVVEDALSGLAAARAAGARTLMLTTSFPAERMDGADWIASDLAHAPDSALQW